MRSQLVIIVLALLATVEVVAQDCQVPVLRRSADGFSLRFETVPAGESLALMPGQPERVVTAIVPASPGTSGDIVRGADNGMILLRCDGDQVRVFVTPPEGGAAREAMTGERNSYGRYVLRVNVVAEDGEEAAFWVRNGRIEHADGPVIDMFKGMVPLEEGDVVVTTEIRKAEESGAVDLVGSVSLGALGPYATVPIELPGGRSGRFLLDLAASRSLVYREILPAETPIQRLVAVEQSAEGTRELGGQAQGAGGAATSVTSIAELDWIGIGDQRLRGFRPLVLDEAFEIDGVAIDGVLGLDVLRRAGWVRADFSRPSGLSILHFGAKHIEDAVEIPLRDVRGLIFVEGLLGTLPMLFLLDSGARLSVLPRSLAEQEGWSVSEDVVDSLRGVDGAPLPVRSVQVPQLRLGDYTAPESGFTAGPIPVLDNLGLREDAAILGQPFWRALGMVEIDFQSGVLRIPRP